ncbi:hypothetical protein [Rhodococcus opacus]|uniref:hypothetical protein n=1 Tax=Rhodococcus opacus TaxID=37919 RepID=UPI0006BB48CE|nr:hypothetical protein [Rhodococcus opacus]
MPSLEDQIYETEAKLAEARRSGTEAQRVQLTSMLTQLKAQINQRYAYICSFSSKTAGSTND